MRFLKVVSVLVSALALVFMLVSSATAEDKNLGIRDVSRVTFVAPMRVGTTLMPAGDYLVRHTMEGQEHIMVFQPVRGKGPEVKVKCTLVQLAQRAERTETIYSLNAANERVLQELVFRGDMAKHVF
jgi:phage terminase large subunit GpA-like protein